MTMKYLWRKRVEDASEFVMEESVRGDRGECEGEGTRMDPEWTIQA
jgi:hypothetical protein